MSNPFSNLPGSDDEDNGKFTQVAGQNKQNAGQKKSTTQQPKTQTQTRDNRPNVNDNLIVNQRENTKNHKSDREQRPNKDITDHRAHDKKSGTGRVSEPKKGGGGRGGIGNIKDQLNQDKILSKVNQEGEVVEEKEPQPQALTLEEYYAKQGLNINDLDKKRQVKVDPKAAPKADWVAKQKLEFVKGKQDLQGESKKVAVLKDQVHKIEFTPQQQLLGFTKDAPKKREERPAEEQAPREPRQNRKDGEKPRGNEKGKNYQERKQAPQQKLVINEQDFPSL